MINPMMDDNKKFVSFSETNEGGVPIWPQFSQEITKIHHLKLDKKLAPKWYKLVLNLSNHNLEEYRVSVWDSFGENIYLPRIQKPANDHITLYFKTAFSIEFLKVKVECSIDVNFSYEMVLFQ